MPICPLNRSEKQTFVLDSRSYLVRLVISWRTDKYSAIEKGRAGKLKIGASLHLCPHGKK